MCHHRVFALLVVVFSACFLALALEAAEEELVPTGYTTRAFVQAKRRPLLDRLTHSLSYFGSGYVLIPLNLAVYGMLYLRRSSRPWLVPALTGGAVA